jgi:hypothetical protein
LVQSGRRTTAVTGRPPKNYDFQERASGGSGSPLDYPTVFPAANLTYIQHPDMMRNPAKESLPIVEQGSFFLGPPSVQSVERLSNDWMFPI